MRWCRMRHLSGVVTVAHSMSGSSRHRQHTELSVSAMQCSWAWAANMLKRTYVSVLPFLLAPFGLLQGRFHLHPLRYGGEGERRKTGRKQRPRWKRKVEVVGRQSDATHATVRTASVISNGLEMDLKNKKWDEKYIIFNILNNIMLKRS